MSKGSTNVPSTDDTTRRAYVVLGMHRSGTSAMTRVLSLLGASLPKNIMEPRENNNPVGFWESVQLMQLNDEILNALDSDWDDVFSFRPRPYLSNFDRFFLGRAIDLIRDQFDGHELIALKDPRVSVLTQFWDRALRQAGFEPSYITMVRNPLEVAESLRARDGFPREKSFLLWSSYMLALERDTRGQRRVFVDYDQLIDDWRAVRRRIELMNGIPFPRDTAAASTEIDRFLDLRLRHHRSSAEEILARGDVPSAVKTLYQVFSQACRGEEIDHAAIDSVLDELGQVEALIGPLVADLRGESKTLADRVQALEVARSSARSEADALASELSVERGDWERQDGVFREQIDDLSARLSLSEAALASRALELEQLRLEISRRDIESERLNAEVLDRTSRIEELERELQQLAQTSQIRSEELAAFKNESASYGAERVNLQAEIERLNNQSKELSGEIIDLRSEIVAAEGEKQKLLREVEERSLANERLHSRLSTETAKLSEARETLSQSERGFEREKNEFISRVRLNHEQLSMLVTQLRDNELELATAKAGTEQLTNELATANDKAAALKRELSQATRTATDRDRTLRQKERSLDWLKQVNETVSKSTRGWRNLLPPRFRRRIQLAAVRDCGLFDFQGYLERNEDVAEAGIDPLLHFIVHGMREGRDGGVDVS